VLKGTWLTAFGRGDEKGLHKRKRKEVWSLRACIAFRADFFPKEEFFSPNASSKAFTVTPKPGVTVSLVTKDPRYSLFRARWKVAPEGTMRFSCYGQTQSISCLFGPVVLWSIAAGKW